MTSTRLLMVASLLNLLLLVVIVRPAAAAGPVIISEVAWGGTAASSADEWIELHNTGSGAIDLAGWTLAAADGSPNVALSGVIPPGGFFLLERSDDNTVSDVAADLIYTGSLSNSGEVLTLLDAAGVLVDSANGDDGPWPAGSGSPDYLSMERTDPLAGDSDGNWHSNNETARNGHDANGAPINGTPGQPNSSYPPPSPTPTPIPTPTPTATPTATPTPTFTPTPGPTATPSPTPTLTPTPTATASPTPYPAGVTLNEFMPDPASDWNGDGAANQDDEYIELYNAGDAAIDLSGWLLDDADGGTTPYALPPGVVIPARGFLLFFGSQTGIGLNNGGDTVRLLLPNSVLVDSHQYDHSQDDTPYSRTVNGAGQWVETYPPSPGAPNEPPPTASLMGFVFEDSDADGRYEPWTGETGIGGVLIMLSDGRSKLTGPTGFYGWHNLPPGQYTVRQAQPLHTSSTTPDELTVTLAAGDVRDDLHFGEVFLPPGQVQTPVLLNEFLPSPASDWDGDGQANADDEWIELYNAGAAPIDLSGWFLDDVEGQGAEPFLIPPGVTIPPGGFLVFYRTTTGVALNNSGDTVRLLGPGYYELEAFPFGSTAADVSWSKTVDGGDQWTDAYPPSPGAANRPAATATPTATPTITPTPTPSATAGPYPTGVALNEFMPDPASDWNGDGATDQDDEYIELYNAGDAAIDLSGWLLDDGADGGATPYALPPDTIIPAGGFLLFFGSQTGIGLNNGGDWVRLLQPDGVQVEAFQYASSQDDEAYSKTSDGGDQWTRDYPPSPGQSNSPGATPTPTSTPTGSPTATATTTVTPTPTPSATVGPYPTGVSLNEFMPDPASDWNGDGAADQNDEYIELYNAGDADIDLGGWLLDDVDDGDVGPDGSPPYPIPPGITIPAGGFLLLFRSQTGLVLNNDGDWVRLLRPDGVLVEAFPYASSRDDEAYSKLADGGDQWTRSYPPSPGRTNTPGGSPTPTSTPTATLSPTPPRTPTPFPTGVSLNEFMPRPASDWNGDGQADPDDEYIELYNASDVAADLSGWLLDDVADGGATPYALPPGAAIPAQGFLLLFRSQTGLALNDSGGDSVRLLWPDGVEVERYDYSTVKADGAYSKLVDGGAVWGAGYPPSPGASNQPAYTPDDVIRLNEVLASPRNRDWDGDGQANYLDEWIELVNAGTTTVNLGGWKLVDGPPEERSAAPDRTYELPAGVALAPGDFLVVYRRESGLALDPSEEWVRLLYPDDVQADALHYRRFSGYDQSRCRLPDGAGAWTLACQETPGAANLAGSGGSSGATPPYDRFNYDLVSVSAARSLPDDTRVTIEGQVTVLPNVLDDRQIYIQDATGGILVYLRSAEWPPLSEGQWVRVNGPLDTFNGEKEVRLTRIDDVKTLGPAPAPQPLPIRSGQVAEINEGRLVQLSAPVTGFWSTTTLYLDDGSGEARITIRDSTGLRRPFVNLGDVWTVIGVVSQWDDEAPYDSGYRILPRRPADLQRGYVAANPVAGNRAAASAGQSAFSGEALALGPPLFLPNTGAGDSQMADNEAAGAGWTGDVVALAAALLFCGLWLRRRTQTNQPTNQLTN